MKRSKADDLRTFEDIDSAVRRDVLAVLGSATALGLFPPIAAGAASAARVGDRSITPLLSWQHYIDLLKPLDALLAKTWEPDSVEQRADLYRQFVMNIAQGYFLYFQTDPEHPDWAPFENSVFMAQPNPDGVYHLALIRGDRSYRVSGFRGTTRVMGFAMGKNMIGMASPPGPGYNNYDADELSIGPDGRFDVLFSSERPSARQGDWRYLNPAAEFILIRQFSYDWGNEQEARFAIECVDAPALKPRRGVVQTAEALDKLLGGYVRRLSELCVNVDNDIYRRGFINKLEFSEFMGNSSGWPQIYWRTIFDVKPGEALILETELPKQCHYWNVQLNDSLWNQVEFAYRQSSLNGHQAKLDVDGKFRAVIALEDPGVPNWLDSGGYTRGMLVGRWYRADSHPLPTIRKVPLDKVREFLPADTPSVSPAERDQMLRARNVGTQMRRRW
jgi:hypothetical protein